MKKVKRVVRTTEHGPSLAWSVGGNTAESARTGNMAGLMANLRSAKIKV